MVASQELLLSPKREKVSFPGNVLQGKGTSPSLFFFSKRWNAVVIARAGAATSPPKGEAMCLTNKRNDNIGASVPGDHGSSLPVAYITVDH